MKTKSSKKAHRAPTISQLVADRNKIASEFIAIKKHEETLSRKHKVGPEPGCMDSAVYVIDETFPQGFPFIKPGKKLTGERIVQLGTEAWNEAIACKANKEDLDYLQKVRDERQAWVNGKWKELWKAYQAAQRKAGIVVDDDQRDVQFLDRLSDFDDAIIDTPARTPAELLAKARRVGHWILWQECRRGETVSDVFAGRVKPNEYSSRAFIRLYRDLERLTAKMGGDPLDLVIED